MFRSRIVKGLWLSLLVLVGSVGMSWGGTQWSDETNGWATVTHITFRTDGALILRLEHPGPDANHFAFGCSYFTPASPEMDAVKIVHSIALSALMGGKQVSVLFDTRAPVCLFYQIMIAK